MMYFEDLSRNNGNGKKNWAKPTTELKYSADCTLQKELEIIFINKDTAGATVVNLPTAVGLEGHCFSVIDKKGDAGANNITLTPNGSEKISGAATNVISTATSVALAANSNPLVALTSPATKTLA